MGAVDDGGGGDHRRDFDPAEYGEFKKLAARVTRLEKALADGSRAGFAWGQLPSTATPPAWMR